MVNPQGHVVGVLSRSLGSLRTAQATGAHNINYALKSSYALAFLESFPEVLAKLPARRSKSMRPLADLARETQAATVLVVAE